MRGAGRPQLCTPRPSDAAVPALRNAHAHPPPPPLLAPPRRRGILFPIAWCVACFMPLCAKRAAKGPKDFLAVRRAAVASSIALCAYLVLVIVLVSMGETRWKRRVCVDRFGNRYYCT